MLGVDVGGTFIKWVHLDDGEIVDAGSVPTPSDGPGAAATAIATLARQQSATRLGVAIPGHLTPDLRRTTIIPNVAGQWDHYPLAATLESLTGLPTVLVNDARAFAIAELARGAARDRSAAVFLTMGTGIGGAIALDHTVLRGPGDKLGEIGHIMVEPDGSVCACGSRGCLETVASGRALVSAWRKHRAGTPSAGTAQQSPEGVVSAARSGDPGARLVLDTAGTAMGRALGSALAMLGLRTVVIGGGVAPAFELMRPATMRVLAARTDLVGPVEVLQAHLGTQAGAIGAALHTLTR
jgi:glucokinase